MESEGCFVSVYKEGLLYAWFSALHTRIDVLLCGLPEAELRQVVRRIAGELDRLEKIANYFDESSELSHINRAAHKDPVGVGDDLFRMISGCKIYHEKTRGYFDITIHSDNYTNKSGYSFVLNPADSTVFFNRQGLRLDLSGFLKGYALDKTGEILRNHSIDNALINFGNSSILALGNHPHGLGWKVKPLISLPGKHEDFLLHNECLTTSGNDTSKRKHIISPDTGKYVDGMRSVSVITPSGTDGEALSTALFIAAPERYPQILRNFDNCRYFICDSTGCCSADYCFSGVSSSFNNSDKIGKILSEFNLDPTISPFLSIR